MSNRPYPLSADPSIISMVRVKNAPVTDDSATLNDTNFPPVGVSPLFGPVQTRNFATVWFGAAFTGGTNPTFELDLLIRDDFVVPDSSPPNHVVADGQRWKRLAFGTGPYAPIYPIIDGSGFVQFRTEGRLVFPRIQNVTGAPTQIMILAFPGTLLGAGSSGRGASL